MGKTGPDDEVRDENHQSQDSSELLSAEEALHRDHGINGTDSKKPDENGGTELDHDPQDNASPLLPSPDLKAPCDNGGVAGEDKSHHPEAAGPPEGSKPHPFSSCTSLEPSPQPPDGGWGWLVVVGCMVGHVLIVGSSRAFGIFYVALIEKFESSSSAAAWVPSLFNSLRMVLGGWEI